MSLLAIVRQKYNPSGGAERIVSAILGELQQQQALQPLLITRTWEPLDGLKVRRINPFYLGSVWRDWGFGRAARAAWQQAGADLVQSHERIPGCHIYRADDGVHAAWLDARCAGQGWLKRLAVALNPYHHFIRRAERAMYLHRDLKKVICISQMVRQDVLSRFPLPTDRCAVIYNGIDCGFFNPEDARARRVAMRRQYGIAEQTPLLLYVGSGFERKGAAAAIRAISAQPEVQLMVVGGDKHMRRYQQLAARLGLTQRVHFCGAQSDVRSYYGMADGFILPSLYEPFGLVVAEAMACGLPVLTSTRCGAGELLQTGVTGWLADARDHAAWQQNVAQWLQAREQWPRMALQTRQRILSLTRQQMVADMLSLYAGLLAPAATGADA